MTEGWISHGMGRAWGQRSESCSAGSAMSVMSVGC